MLTTVRWSHTVELTHQRGRTSVLVLPSLLKELSELQLKIYGSGRSLSADGNEGRTNSSQQAGRLCGSDHLPSPALAYHFTYIEYSPGLGIDSHYYCYRYVIAHRVLGLNKVKRKTRLTYWFLFPREVVEELASHVLLMW